MTSNSYDDEIDQYYKKYYAKVHSSGTLGLANKIMHSRLERKRNKSFPKVLELGCGNFEHFPFVKHSYLSYLATDIRVPSKLLIEKFQVNGVENTFKVEDATNLSFKEHTFDRVLAGCLIVHLADIGKALSEWQRVTKTDGVIDFVIPCDPGILLRVFRRLVSVPQARKFGVNRETYEAVNAYEHVSSFPRTWKIIQGQIDQKRQVKIRYFPFPFLKSWNFNAFAIVSIHGVKID
jgi:ubiquinone/menaquinone biosynthesis C-methylase UbiE